MSHTFWDDRFAGESYVYGKAPNAFLAAQSRLLKRGGRALAVGDGEGRNGVWLARQGLRVVSVDQSEAGLKKARELASENEVAIETRKADLLEWTWPVGAFDVVVLVFVHLNAEGRRHLTNKMLGALKPGGLLILEVFDESQLQYESGGPRDLELLYTLSELEAAFHDYDVMTLEREVITLDEGPHHQGPAAVLRAIVRKPD